MRWTGSIVLLGLRLASAADGPSMPAWLAPFPGATAEMHVSPALTSASYTTQATSADVVAHYRKLFDAAGLPFYPSQDGAGVAIRASAHECDLLLQVRDASPGTSVQVYCAARVSTPAPAYPQTVRRRDVSGAEQVRNMEKFDRPVYPQPKPALPLAWPDWLAAEAPAPIRQGVDIYKLRYLEVQFDTTLDMADLRGYYAALLSANGYREFASNYVRPRDGIGIVEGSHRLAADSTARYTIHCEFVPKDGGLHATLRITAHP